MENYESKLEFILAMIEQEEENELENENNGLEQEEVRSIEYLDFT